MRTDINKIASRITKTQYEILIRTVQSLQAIVDAQLTGQELFYALEAVGLDDPESSLCQSVGADSLGRINCHLCPLGPANAGCMNVIHPIMRKALQGNSRQAQLALEKFIHELTLALARFDSLKKHEGKTTSD